MDVMGAPRRIQPGRGLRALLVVAVVSSGALVATALPAAATGGELTTTTLLEAPYSEPYAGSFGVTAQVVASGMTPIAAGDGTVTFTDTDGYVTCANVPVDASGEATCESGTLGIPASETIKATYNGYLSSFQGSYGTGTLTVDQASTTLTLVTSTPAVGQSGTITATIAPNPGGGTVSFTDGDNTTGSCTSLNVTGGSAICHTSTLTTAGSDAVSATFSGNVNTLGSSNSTSLVISKGSDTFSLSTSGGSVGGTTTVIATIAPDPGGGTVSFSDPDHYLSNCTSVLVVPGGTATCTTNTLSAPGSETVSATYSGDANYTGNGPATTTLTVAQDATGLTLSANPTAPTLGQPFTITATLSPDPGGGSVTFSDPDHYLSGCGPVTVSSGTASCLSSVVTSVGSDQITATYSGDTDYAGTGPTSSTITLAPATPSIAVSSSPSSPTVGQRATITTTVTGPAGAPAPTGTVAFSDSRGFISGCTAVPVSSSTAQCETALLTTAESDSLTATYSGDGNYNPGGSIFTLTIFAAPTTVTLSANPTSPSALTTDLITATVSPVPDGGAVTFTDDEGEVPNCSSVAISGGVATCRTSTLNAGTDLINASYVGDANYANSTATALSLVVSKVATTVTPSASPNPVTDGQSATITASISPVPDGGSVAFSDAFGAIAGCSSQPVSAGIATCTTGSYSGSGTDVVTALYSGHGNYAGGTNETSVVVNRIATTTALGFTPSPAVYSQTDTVTATITPNPESGTVAFSDADSLLPGCGAVPVSVATGTASCTSAALSASGSDSVTALYSGATNDAPSSASGALTIDRAPVFTSPATLTLIVGQASGFSATALGYPAPVFSSSGTWPAGVAFSAAGALTGAPVSGSGGTYDVSLGATNVLDAATEELAITVDQAPAFASPTAVSFPYGSYSSFTVATAPGTYPTPSIAESGSLPPGVFYRDNSDGSGTLYGTPDSGASGTYSLTFQSDNGAGSASQNFVLSITGTPTPTTSPPPTTSSGPNAPATTTTTPTQSLGLSTLEAAVDAGRNGAVASRGKQPSIAVKGKLSKQYDPINKNSTSGRVALGPNAAFPLLGNVGAVGDCTVATVADITLADHLAGRDPSVPRFTTAAAISTWHRLNGNTSNGVTDERLLTSWDSSAGLLGTRITGWRTLTTSNLTQLKKAIKADGAIYAGIVVPDDIGSLGNVWNATVASTAAVSGHALALDGWTAQGFIGITFGGVVLIPYSWWTSHAESAYAVSVVHK